jgi:hypothetical protein
MEAQYPEIPDEIKKLIESGEKIDEIRLDAEGNWFHNGAAFTNERIIDFFNKSINMTRDGEYVISYGNFVYPIVVEDVPFFITGVRFEGFGSFETVYITIRSRGEELLDVDTLCVGPQNALYCRVHGGRFPAKFLHSPSFAILDRLEESDDVFYLHVAGKRIVLKEKVD